MNQISSNIPPYCIITLFYIKLNQKSIKTIEIIIFKWYNYKIQKIRRAENEDNRQ